ncbi:MAG: hypothetical protein CMJ83_07820 [Planctomycetes bacterium]|nr:hypothetical protein [Planctomycetota bacterium]
MARTLIALIVTGIACAQDRQVTSSPEDLPALYARAVTNVKALQRSAVRAGHPSQDALEVLRKDLEDLAHHFRRATPNAPQILYELRFLEVPPGTAPVPADPTRSGKPSDIFRHQEQRLTFLDAKEEKRLLGLGTVLNAPSILSLSGQPATIEVGSRTKVPWLRRMADGTYEMKHRTVRDGLVVNLVGQVSKKRKPTAYVTLSLKIDVTMIVGKTPVEEGAEAIGVPVISSRKTETNVTLPSGSTAALTFQGDDKKTLVALIKATVLDGPPDQGK